MPLAVQGIDRAVAFTLVNRAWGLAAGPVTIVFILGYLTPAEQGFYYAFTSVLGLQVFFELGLGFVVMQTVSHLVAGLRVTDDRVIGGDVATRGRLGRLLADVLRWYSVVCIAFVVIVLVAGGWFLGRADAAESVAWRQPWVVVVPVFALSIVGSACFSFLEGMGFVSDVALARLVQAVLGVIGLWLTLTVGLKLMALVVMHALNLIVAGAWLLRRRGPLLLSIFRERGERGAINWRREIWPFQWRIAASWIGGYCGTQAITLVLFEHLGPVEAGRFGLSLTVLGALASGATAWLTTKAPRFGGFVAQRRYDELVNQYRDAARAAMVVGVLGVVVLLTLVAAFGHLRESLAERFVPLLGLAAMAAATLASIRIGGQAIFLRSFRREPFLTLSIAIGVLQTVVAAVLAREGGVVLVAFGYSAVVVLIGLSWAQIVFMRSRQDYLAR